MKKLIYIILLFMLNSCLFTYDPAGGLLHIRNNSDEAVYVYLKCGSVDLLPLYPGLELFIYIDANMEDAHGNPIKPFYTSPDYRINAYNVGGLHVWGTRKNPRLPCKENEVTLFFITEKTMRNNDWKGIYENQMFVKKTTLTKEELKNTNWTYTYSP